MKSDPAEALVFKMGFLEEQRDNQEPEEPELNELGKLSLGEVLGAFLAKLQG